jgi:hypothetical protein
MKNNDKIQELLKEHTDILLNNFDDFNVIEPDDPDLLRMEEIMEEIKKLEKDES